MATIRTKLSEMGLVLPAPLQVPPGIALPFAWVRARDNRVCCSGHLALDDDGSIARPLGKVGGQLSEAEGYQAARRAALAMLASLERELGDLDRIAVWLRVFGMVNAAPGFDRFPAVINGFSDLILALWGPERGAHARSAIGVAGLPFGTPVEVEAELEIAG
jgi:enamine deaminase RidA (YjgF/YER057c/UK114 family)